MCSFQSLINSIEINDVPAATTILEEFSTPSTEWKMREALRKAIEKKSLQILTSLCNSEVFVGHIVTRANELVQKCVSVDFLEGLKFLLSKGIILQQDGNQYYNPLLQCVREDKLEVLKYLLTLPGINKNPDPDQSLIMTACTHQSVNVLSYLVSSDQRHIINAICMKTFYTPLHQCIKRDGITSVKILVEAGADVNQVYRRGKCKQTPIVMAAEKGMPSVVMYLMDHGANIHISAGNPNTLLHYLARSKNTSDEMGQCVDKLIKAGVPVDKVNIRNETPIYLAVHSSNSAVLKALIQGKCNLNIRSGCQRKSPLSASVSVRNTEATKLLLKAGCNVDLIDGTGITLFSEATRKRKVNLMKLLVSHGANVNIKDPQNNATPALPVAVQAGDSDLTEMLLSAGADFNIKDDNGRAALSIAIANKHMSLTEMLIKAGVDANITDDKGRTPLCIAIDNNLITLTEMLLKAGVDANTTDDEGRTPLCIAIDNNLITLTEMLLKAGVDANIADDNGGTPLCTAIQNYSRTSSNAFNSMFTGINRFYSLRSVKPVSHTEVFEFVKILIEAGANVNQVCQTGERGGKTAPPVFMAADKGIHSVVMFLIDHGANLHINKLNQDTLLHFIARSGFASHENDQCVDKLVKAGVSVNQVNARNETPLYLAALQSNKVVLKALINANCDLNTLCGEPLGLSVVSENTKLFNNDNVTRLSVSAGHDNLFASCDIDITCSTALMLAVKNNHTEITEMLLKAGADTNVKDENGITVLMIATKKSNMIIRGMLLKAGADPNIKDNYGRTALFFVCSMPKYLSQEQVLKGLKQLVEAGAYIEEAYQIEDGSSHTLTPIFAAAKNQMPCVVLYLMELGANIHPDIENQNTLLHYLARSEDRSYEMIQCVDILVKAGLSVNKVNGSNETPLYLAVQSSNNAILEALLKKKCDLNIPCGDNKGSLLTESVKNRNEVKVLTTLLNAGCDANLPDGDGETPLLLATRYKFVEQMQLLVQHGAQVNITDKITGRTPLMIAIEKQSTKLTNCLLQAGADGNTKDDHGCTALHYMYNNGSPSSRTWIHLMKLLMIKGCDTSIECSRNHMRGLSDLMLKTNSINLIWFCITDNWYPKAINGIYIAPAKIFGIEDTLELAKTLYACDFTKSVISSVWYHFRSGRTGQSDDQENQQLSFHKVICSEDLQSRCRKIIRSCIGSNIKDKINEIEIPTTVKNFILLKDVIPDEYFTLAIDDDDDVDVSVRSDYYDHRDNDNDDDSDNDYYDHDGYGNYLSRGFRGYIDYDYSD